MALIGMAIYSTKENEKDACLKRTLESLSKTVDFKKHRLRVCVNSATEETEKILIHYGNIIDLVLRNETNIGTAEAINKVWAGRNKGEHAIKMDDDVVIESAGWIDEMEEAIRREPSIGQIGLKRKDLWENPNHKDAFYKSELIMIPHELGERWIIVEKANHIMGTCQMYSDALLNKIGYLYQPKLYGFDDSFASYRSKKAGFINVFLPHVVIDHIDEGKTPYQKWKENHASECWAEYHRTLAAYDSGAMSIYYNPFNPFKDAIAGR